MLSDGTQTRNVDQKNNKNKTGEISINLQAKLQAQSIATHILDVFAFLVLDTAARKTHKIQDNRIKEIIRKITRCYQKIITLGQNLEVKALSICIVTL